MRRGSEQVSKHPPYEEATSGFGADDARFMRANGSTRCASG